DPHLARLARIELADSAAEGVVNADRRNGADAIWRRKHAYSAPNWISAKYCEREQPFGAVRWRCLDSGIGRASAVARCGGCVCIPAGALPGRRLRLPRQLPDRARRPRTELGSGARRVRLRG